MRWQWRSSCGQEMIEALFSVLAASAILASAVIVFSGGDEGGAVGEPQAYTILRRALSCEVWVEDGAVNVDVIRDLSDEELQQTLDAGGPFLLRIYAINGSGEELLVRSGTAPEGERSVVSSPVIILLGTQRLSGRMEVVA